VIAFEMAQQLHAQGQQVALLALFDTLQSFRYTTTSLQAWQFWQEIGFQGQPFTTQTKEKLTFLLESAKWSLRTL